MNVPPELAVLDQWVCWKLTTRKGKTTKVPHKASDGRLASTTNSSHWCDFETALEAAEQWHMDGIGFVFSKNDPYYGLDFDHCIVDGDVIPTVRDLVESHPWYVEFSPSRTGLHCIAKGKLERGFRTKDIEAYDHGRYFTFTGEVYNGCSEIHEVPPETWMPSDDDRIIANCIRNSDGFVDLFQEGDTSNYDDNHSRADLALANMIAARTQDPEQVERIMRRSALAREKWDHPDTGATWLVRRVIEPAIRDAPKGKEKASFWSGDFEKDVAQQVYMMEVRDEARHRLQEKQVAARVFPYPNPAWSLADELALPPREEVWRVQGLQQIHANVVLIAGYKLGKTTLVMNLVRSLVDGTPFMGEYEVSPVEGNVAVFNYELHEAQWIDWARDMKIQHPEKVKPFHLRGLGTNKFWVPSEQDRLVAWMVENSIKYWVLDPTAQAWATLLESEGDNIRAAQFTAAIDEVKARAGIDETNLTHHTSRANQEAGRGPSALEGWYDAGWFLTGKRDELKFHAIGRDVDVEPTSIAYHEDRRRTFLLDHRDEKEKLAEKKNAKRTAIEILTEMGPLSQSALGKELKLRGCGISSTQWGKVFQGWVGSMDNPMAVRQVGQAKTYYLQGVEGHE